MRVGLEPGTASDGRVMTDPGECHSVAPPVRGPGTTRSCSSPTRLLLDDIAVDGCITKAPGGGECAGPSPVDRRKQGLKRSVLVEGYGIPLGRVLAGANRHDSPLLEPTLDRLDGLGPLPDEVTVHLDAGYDSDKTRSLLDERGLCGEIAHKGEKAPIQATRRWHV